MFDRVLNMPLDYRGCTAVVLRGVHKKVNICQTAKLITVFTPNSDVVHGSTTLKLTKG